MTSDKKAYTITAKTVILSASTFETPRILLNFNIPGDAIGRYLVDHSVVLASATADRNEFPEDPGIVFFYVPDSAGRKYQLMCRGPYFYKPYQEVPPYSKTINFLFDTYGVVEPQYRNGITLNPSRRDDYGVPLIDIHFSLSEQDEAIIQEMLVSTSAFISSLKLTVKDPPRFRPPGGINHEAGTCRMGIDPVTSATNLYGQIHGISGLYVQITVFCPSPGAPIRLLRLLRWLLAQQTISLKPCRKNGR